MAEASTVSSSPGTRFMVQWEEHPMHLATRLGYLLEHQSLVDVTLMCNTHTLKVHRAVLAACSPYFESVLQRQLGNHPLIVLKDMKFSVLKSLIEFMYCGETSVTEENLNPLMEAAKFFEVKGLCTMSKEVLAGERPSPNKVITGSPVNGATSSYADIFPSSLYRGRGRRPGIGRGRRNLTPMLISPPQGPPQAETAQIMLSLSGKSTTTSTSTYQTSSSSVCISPKSRLNQALPSGSRILDSTSLIRNGSVTTMDIKALRERLNSEPRKRGRRRQSFGFGRGRIRELIDGKLGTQNIKKEVHDIQQKDGILFKPLDSKLNLLNNNGNNDTKSPLLATLLSKAEALAKSKIKCENNTDDGEATESEQETVLYQFDGESSGASKYLEALKEAGLPTDVPVLIDDGNGNYVTLTEDVLMDVLGNNDEFQFQVTEATLVPGSMEEGVFTQDGTIMMPGKKRKTGISGPIVMGKKPITIQGVRGEPKGKRNARPKQLVSKESKPIKPTMADCPKNEVKKENGTTKSVQELINEAVLENLKNGAANEAEADPDAVVLFEVTDNNKVCKYVVSSKEISALKALNEQLEKQKTQNSPNEKKSPLPTVIDGNTNIAEIKLTVSKNSRKSIVSEVLARAHILENQVNAASMLNDLPPSSSSSSPNKNEVGPQDMLNSVHTESKDLNSSPKLVDMGAEANNLETHSLMDLDEEHQIVDDSGDLIVLKAEKPLNHVEESRQSGILITGDNENLEDGDNEGLIDGDNGGLIVGDNENLIDGDNEDLIVGDNENLIVVNGDTRNNILQQTNIDLSEDPSNDSQLMHINENSLTGEETEEGNEMVSGEEGDGTMSQSGRDMPLLENEGQLVELELVDENGKKIKIHTVDRAVLSQSEISELTRLQNGNKGSSVIDLLDMVCEVAVSGASQVDLSGDVLNDVSTLQHSAKSNTSVNVSLTSNDLDNYTIDRNRGSEETEHLVLDEVQKLEARHLESVEMLDEEGDCQELSVEQALQAMMGEGNSAIVESEEFNQEINPVSRKSLESTLDQISVIPEPVNSLNTTSSFEFDYDISENENPPDESVHVVSKVSEINLIPEDSTNKVITELKPLQPEEIVTESIEASIISPTKDVPFAVGLLPLKDALEQIQSIQDHQPRKTRSSGSTNKPETVGVKRRSSGDISVNASLKRRKSIEEGNEFSNQVDRKENVASLT